MTIPPTIGCPTCASPISVVTDCCGMCGTTFSGRELWDRYEKALADLRALTNR